MKVLIIEDNSDHASLIARALNGHSLTFAVGLRRALEVSDLSSFDAIVSDLSLPDVSGVDTVAEIRRQAADMPLVVLTCSTDDVMAHAALERGAQDYLVKEEVLGGGAAAGRLLDRSIRYAVLRQESRREIELLVRELRESQQLLQSKNERLETLCDAAQKFVESVSHDFRTPLTVIKEYGSLICDGVVGPVNSEQRQMLHVVEDRADDLNTMVDDLLDVSKLDAGLINVWRRRSRLCEIMGHVLPGLERKAAVRGVSLTTSIAEDLPEVFCDQEKVGRIVTNLVVNGIKFCREDGHVRLWAEARDDRREVVVGISDNGPGIACDKQEQIFERFLQLEGEARQSTKGFGLGLSIAKELVDLNLGVIAVQSAPDEGATFTFTLPYDDPRELLTRYAARIRGQLGADARCLTLLAEAPPETDVRDLHDLDIFLNHNVRRNDLAVRLDRRRWRLFLLVAPAEIDEFIERTQAALVELNRNRPFGPLPDLQLKADNVMWFDEPLEMLVEQFLPITQPQEACYV